MLIRFRKIPIPDSKRLAGLGHAEGNVQLTAEHVAFVRGDGRHIVETPEETFEHLCVASGEVGLVWYEVHHILIHVTDEKLDLWMPLQGIVNEFLNLVHRSA